MPDLKGFGGWKFLIYIAALLVGLSLFQYVFLSRLNPAIDFSEFKARIATGEIKRVELTDSYVTGFTSAVKQQSPRFGAGRPPYGGSQDKVYRAVSIYDPEFIKFLDEKNVAYSAPPREGNAILSFIFSWVLPVAFLFSSGVL